MLLSQRMPPVRAWALHATGRQPRGSGPYGQHCGYLVHQPVRKSTIPPHVTAQAPCMAARAFGGRAFGGRAFGEGRVIVRLVSPCLVFPCVPSVSMPILFFLFIVSLFSPSRVLIMFQVLLVSSVYL